MKLKNFIKSHKKLVIFFTFILLVFICIGIYVYIGVMKTETTVKKLQSDMNYIKGQQNAKSIEGIVIGLQHVQSDITLFKGNLAYFTPLKYIPLANNYYNNAIYMLNGATSITNGAIKIASNSEPIANALGYGSHPVDGTAKIAAFVGSLPTLTQAVDSASSDFQDAQKSLALVDPAYLPDISIKGINLKKSFPQYESDFNNFVDFLPKVDSIAPQLQKALGDPKQRNYLLVFQNDKELRPTGGFFTAYGYLTFNKGSLGDIKTTDIYQISNGQTEANNPPAPAQLKQYNAADKWYLRDANLSPDVPTTATQIETFYNRLPSDDRRNIDGIVFIDTQFVASLLDAVGPVYVSQYKQTVDASNFAYYLELYSEKIDVNNPPATRKQFINLLMTQLKQKVFSAQKDSLVKLIQGGMQDITQKHLSMYANDPKLEDLIKLYNWGGVFPTNTGSDFFAMVEANLGGAKADFYIQRNLTSSIEKTAKGYMKTVKVTFTNDQVYDDWLNGPYKAWVRFYLPQGSQLISINGADTYYAGQATLRQYDELGYSVVDDHINVPVKLKKSDPATKLTVTLKYYLPQDFTTDNGYSLYLYKQAGVKDINTDVLYNGKEQKLDITNDHVFSF